MTQTALILSSHVAASRVGGMAQALTLQALGIDPILAPTVLFGRHPGWGAPGGAPVPAETVKGMLSGIEAQGLYATLDLVITGYFATADQVSVAAQAVAAVRAANPNALVVADPVMGDEGKGLYVRPAVAEAQRDQLVPLADVVAPNRFELGWLTGQGTPVDAAAAKAMALRLGRPVLVSSIPGGADEIGVLLAEGETGWLALHARAETAPNGTGDVLTALFAGWRVRGEPAPVALTRAAAGVAGLVEAAVATAGRELPIVAGAQALCAPSTPVRIEIV